MPTSQWKCWRDEPACAPAISAKYSRVFLENLRATLSRISVSMRLAVGFRSGRRRFAQSPRQSASPARTLSIALSSESSALDRVTTSRIDSRDTWQHRMVHTNHRRSKRSHDANIQSAWGGAFVVRPDHMTLKLASRTLNRQYEPRVYRSELSGLRIS